MRRLREQRGFTLMETLITMSLLTVMIGATVAAFVSFNTNERVNRRQNEAQDRVRTTVDRLSRELRNLASPTDFEPKAIERASDYDLVFQTVDATQTAGPANERRIVRVRYCVSDSAALGETLWRQRRAVLDDVMPSGACPNAGWGSSTRLADDVVSREQNDPIFTFTPGPQPETDIKAIQTEVFVDVTPGEKSPSATRLASGVFLRNQNRRPVASCTATATGNGNQVVLNGSASYDPEERTLRMYEWLHAGNVIGKNVVTIWTAPGPGTYTFQLRVTDYGGLPATADCGEGVVIQ